jgi:putative hemolysin
LNPAWTLYALAAVAALFLSAFFSGAETGMYCVNRVRLHLRTTRGERAAGRLSRFLHEEQSALSVTLIGTNVMNYAITAIVASFLAHELKFGDRDSEVYTTLLVTPVIFVFGEMVPKNLFRVAADRWMLASAWGLSVARSFFAPLAWTLRGVVGGITRMVGPAAMAGDELLVARWRMTALIHEGLIHTGSEPEHFDLVERVLALSGTPVRSIMIPRNRIVAVSADASRRDLLAVIRKSRHDALLVYDRDPRRIVGRIVAHRALAGSDEQTVRSLAEPIMTLDSRETVASTIVRMQKEHQTMAVVVDRNGWLLGLVTLTDLMEEIVGELAD